MSRDPALLAARLLTDGFCIIPDACPPETIAALNADFVPRFAETPFCKGGFYGDRTKRFGALLRRSVHAELLVRHRLILQVVETVLGEACDRIVLNLTQAVELHPGALPQIPHRDQDLWRAQRGGQEYQVNVIWPLTPFTEENGATQVWPESHRAEAPDGPAGEALIAEMHPGSALLFLGSLLHGAGENLSSDIRRCAIVGYCLGWLRTFENQYLVYPPAIARDFDPDLAALVGYAQHRPNLGNVEGQSPSILFVSEDLDNLGAIDALTPEQADALASYVAEQAASRTGAPGD